LYRFKNLFFIRLYFSVAFLLSFSSVLADLASDTIYLTWQRDPTTTMTIQWITPNGNDNNTIGYHVKGEEEWKKVEGSQVSFPHAPKLLVHQVELTKLKPATDYVFKYNESEYFFRTMPINLDKPVRFVEGGDMYQDGIGFLIQTCRQAAKTNPDFAVIGGDIAYAVGRLPIQNIDRWVDWISTWHKIMITEDKRMIPVVAAIGNHDLIGQYGQTPAQAKIFSTLFPRTGGQIYNVLDFGNYLSLLILDSGHATPVAGPQTEWLKSTLQDRRDVTYLFAFYHVPAYPSVRKFNNSKSTLVRKNWTPIFDREGLDLAFEHNDHAYKRTHPLLNNRINSGGVIYLGDGAWGVEPRKSRNRRKPFYLARFVSSRHFILVNLKSDGYQVLSIDPRGLILDEFFRP